MFVRKLQGMNKKYRQLFLRVAVVSFASFSFALNGMTVFAQPYFQPLPTVSMPAQGDFFQKYTELFQNAAQQNLYGIGKVFSLDRFFPVMRSEEQATIRDSFVEGVRSRIFMFREVEATEDDEVVLHEVVEDGEVVYREARPPDISILHALPRLMRRDGVNEGLVRFIEEEINIVNFYLAKARDEWGLVLPSGNFLQLAVPPGYSPVVFQSNFIAILVQMLADRE